MGYTTSTVHGIEVPDSAEANNVPEDIGKVVTALEGGSIVKRLTSAQIAALTAPQKPAGLVVYNTTTSRLQVSDGTNFKDVPALASSGAWTSYTPTVTGWTLGNGTVSGKWTQIGKTVHGRAKVTIGTTTVITGTLTMALPATNSGGWQAGTDVVMYAGTSYFKGMARLQGSTLYVGGYNDTLGTEYALLTTRPASWTAGNFVEVTFTYETA
jgi:hypothetical protein